MSLTKAEIAATLDKLQLGMDEVHIASKLKDGVCEKHHDNGMVLLKEVRDWLIEVKHSVDNMLDGM